MVDEPQQNEGRHDVGDGGARPLSFSVRKRAVGTLQVRRQNGTGRARLVGHEAPRQVAQAVKLAVTKARDDTARLDHESVKLRVRARGPVGEPQEGSPANYSSCTPTAKTCGLVLLGAAPASWSPS